MEAEAKSRYHNREVSYSSILDLSVTARQQALYGKHGLDIERWTEMGTSASSLSFQHPPGHRSSGATEF